MQAGVGVGGRDYWSLRGAAEDVAAPTLGQSLLRPGAQQLRRWDADGGSSSLDVHGERGAPLRTADLDRAGASVPPPAVVVAAPPARLYAVAAADVPEAAVAAAAPDSCALPLFVGKRRPRQGGD
jgi:hypothetical protein